MGELTNLREDDALATLRRDGVSVHEGYIAGELLEEIREEFDRYLIAEEEGVIHVEHKPGKSFRILVDNPHLREINQRKSRIAGLFFNETLRKITEVYIPGATYCEGLLGTNEFRAMPVTEVHFDTIRSLKYMIYLDDTTAQNGAFSYARGTHKKNSTFRDRFAMLGGVSNMIPNALAEEHRARVSSIEAAAGTLILFDTDGLHAGGVLQEGRTRRVIRARSTISNREPWKLAQLMPYRIKHSGLNPAMLYSKIAAPGYRATMGTARAKGDM